MGALTHQHGVATADHQTDMGLEGLGLEASFFRVDPGRVKMRFVVLHPRRGIPSAKAMCWAA